MTIQKWRCARHSPPVVVVECHSCNNVGLRSARFLLSLGFPPYTSIKSLQRHTRCRGCGVRGKATYRSGGGRMWSDPRHQPARFAGFASNYQGEAFSSAARLARSGKMLACRIPMAASCRRIFSF
jgi:hypothetical protein